MYTEFKYLIEEKVLFVVLSAKHDGCKINMTADNSFTKPNLPSNIPIWKRKRRQTQRYYYLPFYMKEVWANRFFNARREQYIFQKLLTL